VAVEADQTQEVVAELEVIENLQEQLLVVIQDHH
jgi:hypothetical protein